MSDFDEETEQRSSRSWLWLFIAAGVLAVIVAMGIFVSIATITDDDNPTANPKPTEPVSTAPTTPADPDKSICGLPGHKLDGTLNQPPENVTWNLVGAFAAPASRTAGPGTIEKSGLRYCYAHTPEGALLAAANVYTWGQTSRTDRIGVIEHGVASGPGYDAAIAQAKADTGETSEPTLMVQIRGFRLLSYSGTSALVDLAFQGGPSGGLAHHQVELIWERGDWRVQLRSDGSAADGGRLPDLTNFTPWAGA